MRDNDIAALRGVKTQNLNSKCMVDFIIITYNVHSFMAFEDRADALLQELD